MPYFGKKVDFIPYEKIKKYQEKKSMKEHLALTGLQNIIELRLWDVKLKIAINIAEGLFECHHHFHKIVHLNINFENILVDKNLELKIGGFEKFSDDPEMKKHYRENPELSAKTSGSNNYLIDELNQIDTP
ncbi:34896_t:CDS:2, partial [Gigaspora margarita]